MKKNNIFTSFNARFAKIRRTNAYRITKKVLLGMLAAGITAGVLCAAVFVYYVFNYTDPELDLAFENLSLDYSSVIYAKDSSGQYSAVEYLYKDENRIWVSYEKIPDYMKKATIAIEDKRYLSHKGVDWKRTAGAVVNYAFKTKDGYGGSTITQQLIKNITGDDAKSPSRKVKEIFRALYIERKYSKNQILEYYLNTVTFGGSCQGVQSAAKRYFNKDVSELSLVESICIVGITNNPSLYDPYKSADGNKARAGTILYEMKKSGDLTEAEYEQAKTDLAALQYYQNSDTSAASKQSYFVDQVISDVVADLIDEKGYSTDYATELVYTKGLKIYTTMDPEVQGILDEVYMDDSNFPKTVNKDGVKPQSSMVVMDPDTGDVLGIAGGRGEKTINRGFNYATQAKRQPGSTMKPIAVYAPAIEANIINAASVVDDAPTSTDGKWPKNYNGYYSGLMTIRNAILQSNNCVPVRIIEKLGTDKSFNFLTNKLHISTLISSKVINGKTYTDITPSLALGGITDGVTVLEMTAAYQIFPNQGLYNESRTYTKVETVEGKTLLEKNVDTTQVISAQTAYSVHQFLEENMTNGTGTPAKVSATPSAGKTGTTTEDKDRWFMGYTPNYVVGTWFGYEDPQTLTSISSNPCSKLFKTVMDKINAKKGLSGGEFTVPANMTQMTYCVDSGMPVGDACALDPRGLRTETCWVTNSQVPTQTCNIHHKVYICTASGKIAHSGCPKECLKEIALVNHIRQYSQEITIGDSKYMLPFLDRTYSLFKDSVWPVYMTQYAAGTFPGKPVLDGSTITNTLCTVHTPVDSATPAQ